MALINDILDFSKIEAGKLMLEQRPFSLQQCIEHTVELIAPRAAEKGLELGCLIEDDVPAWISGDEGRLKQILLNLLGNAVKFTERGEIVVTVRRVDGSDSDDGTSPALLVSVRDTGIGIPIERQQRLFHPFTQVDASTTRKYGGTGLGLAISRRLCEAMGGKIWVESNGSKGATFRFTIPANPAPTPDQSPIEHPALTGRQLMIVMGSFGTGAQWRSVALHAIRFGMQVRITETVEEALDWHATGQPIDVMLADHRLFAANATMNGNPLNGHTWPLLLLAPVNYRPGNIPETTVGYVLQPVRQAQFRDALVRVFEPAFTAPPPPWTATAAFDENLAERLPLEILVVEDNPVNQFVIRRLLQRFGYTAVTAESGARCLELCTTSRFDLIFMDMQMPGMDGLETTRRLRAMLKVRSGGQPGPAIVALTANVGPEDRAACLDAGMDDFLSKPVQVAALRTMLERMSVQRVDSAVRSNNPATR
ncbi:MAG: response regulator [Anaerolineales bacterium]|nr:response regulator [Anaerolineales bacterium]